MIVSLGIVIVLVVVLYLVPVAFVSWGVLVLLVVVWCSSLLFLARLYNKKDDTLPQ